MVAFEDIAEERRSLARILSGLAPEQQRAPSLCHAWTVHDVAAHLIMPMEVHLLRFAGAMLAAGGSFDRANQRLTARIARRPFAEIVDVLERRADSRFTPPGEGPEAPLTDVIVHSFDICWPLGIPHEVAPERIAQALDAVAKAPSGIVPKGALEGLRFEADGIGWGHGSGPVVRGEAPAVLLAMTGRAAALERLTGDGVAVLAERLSARGDLRPAG